MEHKHHAKSSLMFIGSEEILDELNLKGDEAFMDAGCGDGHIAIKAIEEYLPDGFVYAVDNYDPSIEELQAYKKSLTTINQTLYHFPQRCFPYCIITISDESN